MKSQVSSDNSKEAFTKNLIQTISALVEVEVSAFLDGVGTVQNKQPISGKPPKKLSKQEKIEAIKNKAKKRFS